MKSLMCTLVVGLYLLTPAVAIAEPVLKKALDGYVAHCPSELANANQKLMSLSLEEGHLVIQAKVCMGSRMVNDILPRSRSFHNEEGIEITEQFYNYKAVLVSDGVEPIVVELKDFWHSGRSVIDLAKISLPKASAIEVFVTAQKEVQASNGVEFNAGIVSWGAYILK